jgi:hypothetical protein
MTKGNPQKSLIDVDGGVLKNVAAKLICSLLECAHTHVRKNRRHNLIDECEEGGKRDSVLDIVITHRLHASIYSIISRIYLERFLLIDFKRNFVGIFAELTLVVVNFFLKKKSLNFLG